MGTLNGKRGKDNIGLCPLSSSRPNQRIYRFLDYADLECGLLVCRTWRQALTARVCTLWLTVDRTGASFPHTPIPPPSFSRVSALCLQAGGDGPPHVPAVAHAGAHKLAAASQKQSAVPMSGSAAAVGELLGHARTLALLPLPHLGGGGRTAAAAAPDSSGRPQQHQQYATELNLLALLCGLHHHHTTAPGLQVEQRHLQQEGQPFENLATTLDPARQILASVHHLLLLGAAWQLRPPALAAAAAAGLPKPLTSLADGLCAYLPNLTYLDLAPSWELTPAGLALAAGDGGDWNPAVPRPPDQQEQGSAEEEAGGTCGERLSLSNLLAAGSRGGAAHGRGGGGGGGPGGCSCGVSSGRVAGSSCAAVDLAAARGFAGLPQLRHISACLAIGDSDRMAAWAGVLAALPPALTSLKLLGPLCYCPDLAAAVAGWRERLPALRQLHLELGECCHSHPDLESEMYGDPDSWTSSCFAGVLPKLTQLRSLQLDVDDITADLWRDVLACYAAAVPAVAPVTAVATAAVAVHSGPGDGDIADRASSGDAITAGSCTEVGMHVLRLRQRGFSGACDGAGIANLHGLTDLCLTLGDGPNLSHLSCLTRLTRLELQLLGLADYVAAAADAAAAVAAEVQDPPAITENAATGLSAVSCRSDGGGTAACSVRDTDAVCSLAALAGMSLAAEPSADAIAHNPLGGRVAAFAESASAAAGSLPMPCGLLPLITRGLCRLQHLHLNCRSAAVGLEELGAIGRPGFCPRLRLLQLQAPLRAAFAAETAAAPPVVEGKLSSGPAPQQQRHRGSGICLPDQLEWLGLANTETTAGPGASWVRPVSSRGPQAGATQRPSAPPLLRLAGLPPGLRNLQLMGITLEVDEAHNDSSSMAGAEEEGQEGGRAAAGALPGPGASSAAAQAHTPQACTASVSLVGCVVRWPLARLWGSGLRVLDLTGSTLLAPPLPCSPTNLPAALPLTVAAGATLQQLTPVASAAVVAAATAAAPSSDPSAALAEALARCAELRQLRLWGSCRSGGLLRPLGDAALAALAAAHPRLTGLEINATAATPEGLAALATLRHLRALRVLVAGQEGAAALGRTLAAARAATGAGPGPGTRARGPMDLKSLEVVMAASGLAFVADCLREQLVAGLPGVAVQLRAQQPGE